MEDSPARLIVTRGPNINQQVALTRVEVTLGRSATNDVVLAAPEISRRHAVIFFRGDAHFLEDLGSTNGTFVNGNRLSERVRLNGDDIIQFGDSIVMRYEAAGASSPAPAPEPESVSHQAPTAVPAAVAAEIATPPPAPAGENGDDFILEPQPAASQRSWLLGCGCVPLLLAVLCLVSVFALDAYQGGRLLYCGALRPVFELLLGPFGFNPVCTAPF